jgi:hypothetical protein
MGYGVWDVGEWRRVGCRLWVGVEMRKWWERGKHKNLEIIRNGLMYQAFFVS